MSFCCKEQDIYICYNNLTITSFLERGYRLKNIKNVKISVLSILLILLLVVIMPMYLLGYGLYQWGYQMTTTGITQSLHTRASFFITTFETELIRIRNVHQECLNDKDLYYYVNASAIMDLPTSLNSLLSIEKRLGLVQHSSAYIEDVILWMPKLSHMISSTKGIVQANEGWREIVQAPYISNEAGLSVYDGHLYMYATYPPGQSYPGYLPQYVLAIRLSNERMLDDLLSFNLYPESGTLLQSENQLFQLKTGRDIGVTGIQSKEEISIQPFHSNQHE